MFPPTTVLSVMGIVIDVNQGTFSIEEKKKHKIHALCLQAFLRGHGSSIRRTTSCYFSSFLSVLIGREGSRDVTMRMRALDFIPRMRTLDFIPCMRTLDFIPRMRTLDFISRMRTLDFIPRMRTLDFISRMRALDFIPRMRTLVFRQRVL